MIRRFENRTPSPDTLSVGKDGVSYQGGLEIWFRALQSGWKYLPACTVYQFRASGVKRDNKGGSTCAGDESLARIPDDIGKTCVTLYPFIFSHLHLLIEMPMWL